MKLRPTTTPRLLAATALAAGTLVAAPAAAQDEADPAKLSQDAWVSLSGEVASAGDGTFRLDHGDGLITVETGGWESDDADTPVRPGDRVSVFGYVDGGFYERRAIEASVVWNARGNTFHFASDAETDGVTPARLGRPALRPERPTVIVTGKVTGIDGRELSLITAGATQLEVDTSGMPYDPLDATGAQVVTVGDRISVAGELEADLFEEAVLTADGLLLMNDLDAPTGQG